MTGWTNAEEAVRLMVIDAMASRRWSSIDLAKASGVDRRVIERLVARTRCPMAVAHELGHWALRSVARAELGHAEEERAANTFAAALLAPSPLVRAAYELFGERHDVMAERLRISQTSTVLRLGEVRGDPRAVVTRTGHVFVRNQSPTLTRERAAAVAHGRPVRGVAKARLRGGIDEGRVALRVG